MLRKLNNLAFVIGLFFTIVSIILFINILIGGRSDILSIGTASIFLVFGVVMMVRN